MTWSNPSPIILGKYGWAYAGPGRGLLLESEMSPVRGRILFIGHHGAYEVSIESIQHILYTSSNIQCII